jgi:hypothetical protein
MFVFNTGLLAWHFPNRDSASFWPAGNLCARHGRLLIRLLGWHWAFLPTLMIEALPGADLFPTWTAAVFFATRQLHHPGEPVILPPESPIGRTRT